MTLFMSEVYHSAYIKALTSKICQAAGRRSGGVPFHASLRISAARPVNAPKQKRNLMDVQISASSLVRAETNLWRLLVLMDRSRMSVGLFAASLG